VRPWPTGAEAGGRLPRGWPGRPPTEVDVAAVVRSGAGAMVGCLTRLVIVAAILVALVVAFFSGLFGAEPESGRGPGGAPAAGAAHALASPDVPEAGAFGPAWGINPPARATHRGRTAAGGPPVRVCTVQGAARRSETSGRAVASSRRTSRDSLLPLRDSFNQFPAA
jgi:hypothetical protein